MKKLSFVLILVLLNSFCFAQNRKDIQKIKQQILVAQEDTSKVKLLYTIAFSYAFVHGDSAIVFAKQGLDLSKKLKYTLGEIKCLDVLCTTLGIVGNYSSALHYGFKGLELSEALQDSSLIVDANLNLLICYREYEDYEEALKYGFKALSFLESPKVLGYQKVLAFGFISSVYERNNQLDSALYYGLKANSLRNNYEWAGLYLVLGNTYLKLKQTKLAFLNYEKGISIAKRDFIYIDLVDIYNKLSIAYESMGEIDSSFNYAKKSIEVEGVNSYPEGKLRASVQLAHLYEVQGEKDSTIKYLKLSADLRNGLVNRQKTREIQAFAFNKQLNEQKLASQYQENQDKIKLYVSFLFVLASIIVTFLLYRNNQHKQKTNSLLQVKNKEIQSTLTKLKFTQSQLIQSEKMASLGQLTAGIAHEIQNPLNFVNNFSEVSNELISELKVESLKVESERDRGLEDEILNDIAQNLEKINHHGKRASDIVKGMLEHSRKSTGEKEFTDINALCDEYLRLAYQSMKAKDNGFNATMETHFDPNLPKIEIIPQDIGRVILNLINNAFYAVSEKSKVETSKEKSRPSGSQKSGSGYEPTVSITTQLTANSQQLTANTPTTQQPNSLIISIKDNGSGIPEHIKDKIFQPFFTTKPTGQGTGLGLSLAYDIVKAHGGELKVETKEGEMSEFVILLPL